MRVAFITLASKDYFPGAKVLFESIKHHTHSPYFESVLFSDEMGAESYFDGLFDKIEPLPKSLEDINISDSVPRFRFTLYKLFVLKFLEQYKFDRVVFFDSDLICLSSLDYLLSPELNNFDFLAVRDFACTKYYSAEIYTLGLVPESIFNTGCFVVNRSILDFITYEDLIFNISGSAKSYDGGDQGFFNFVVQNSDLKFCLLPLRFNYPLDVNYPLLWIPPSLIHFTGDKPWVSSPRFPVWDRNIYKMWNWSKRSQNQQRFDWVRNFFMWNIRNFRVTLRRYESKLRSVYIAIRNQFI